MKEHFPKFGLMLAAILIFVALGFSFDLPNDSLFQNPPGDTPRVFAPGIVSVSDRYEYGLAISPDWREIFFTAEQPATGPKGLLVMRKNGNGTWSEPTVANLRGTNAWEMEAFYSPDGSRLFFSSDDKYGNSKIWYTDKSDTGWGTPVMLGPPVNNALVFWPTVSNAKTLYYTAISKAMIFRSKFVDNKYGSVEIVLPYKALHPTIAPDESFLLYNISGDLFVVFNDGKEGWSKPYSLGPEICSKEFEETCVSLSPDGKYLFFSRYNDKNDKSDIYWVSAGIIDKLKKAAGF